MIPSTIPRTTTTMVTSCSPLSHQRHVVERLFFRLHEENQKNKQDWRQCIGVYAKVKIGGANFTPSKLLFTDHMEHVEHVCGTHTKTDINKTRSASNVEYGEAQNLD